MKWELFDAQVFDAVVSLHALLNVAIRVVVGNDFVDSVLTY